MRVFPQQVVVVSPPGSFRRWLKSDMRIMRWVLLVIYLGVVTTCLWSWFSFNETISTVFGIILIVSQIVFMLGVGTVPLCRPIRRRRLLLPVIAAALMMTVLIAGLALAMSELFYVNGFGEATAIFWAIVCISWIAWGFLLFFHVRDLPRFRVISNLANYLFVGSLAELLATVPAHIIVSRRPGCFVGIGTMLGIVAGVSVMFFSFGPMILLLFLRPQHRAELADGIPRCPNCNYDLRATPARCPECGLQIAST